MVFGRVLARPLYRIRDVLFGDAKLLDMRVDFVEAAAAKRFQRDRRPIRINLEVLDAGENARPPL